MEIRVGVFVKKIVQLKLMTNNISYKNFWMQNTKKNLAG
jgi:hypothetical protein